MTALGEEREAHDLTAEEIGDTLVSLLKRVEKQAGMTQEEKYALKERMGNITSIQVRYWGSIYV